MRRLLVGLLATIGGLVVVLAIAGGLAAWLLWPAGPPQLPDQMVLTLDLREGLDEVPASDPLSALEPPQATLHDLVVGLERAARDERVKGLLVEMNGEGLGFAQIQEVREAVSRLRDAGRFTLAYAESFGEFGPGTAGYYLASAFDQIHLQPQGALGLTGLMLEAPLFRGVLENLGIQPEGDRRGEYKNIYDQFTAKTFTESHEEALQSLATSIYDQLTADLAEARGLEPEHVRYLIDNGPYVASEALDVGLVDQLSHYDQAIEAIRSQVGNASEPVPLESYLASLPEPGDAPVVALIHGVGPIARGTSEGGPVRGLVMGSDTVAGAIRDARDDPEVRAILFRIDSGGGSAVASESIGYEIRRTVEAGKPVIASMGDTAASGGYWIAMDASRITARPATLTGSIGVVVGKPVLADLYDEVGLQFGRVARGDNATMWSSGLSFDAEAKERLESFLDHTYAAFKQGVARGRGLDPEAVEAAAKGRVWSGAQALDLDLVDDLGGHAGAIAGLRDQLGAAPEDELDFQIFPRPKGPLEQVLELVGGPLASLDGVLTALQALLPTGSLSAPPLRLR